MVNTEINSYEYSLLSDYHDSCLYLLAYKGLVALKNSDTLIINKINTYSQTKEQFFLLCESYINMGIDAIKISRDKRKCVFISKNQIQIFTRRDDNNIFKHETTIATTGCFYKAERIGDKILLYDFYNHHPDDHCLNSEIGLLDLTTNTLEHHQFVPFNDLWFTHFPGQFCSSNGNKFVLSNTTDYSCSIYDSNLIVTNKINRKIPKWKDWDPKNTGISADFRKTPTYQIISDIRKIDKDIFRIEKVFLSNDSLLWVFYKSPKHRNRRFLDVWFIDSTSNNLIIHDQSFSNKLPTPYVLDRFVPSYSNDIFIVDGRIIQIYEHSLFADHWWSFAKIWKIKKHYKKNDPNWGVVVFDYLNTEKK